MPQAGTATTVAAPSSAAGARGVESSSMRVALVLVGAAHAFVGPSRRFAPSVVRQRASLDAIDAEYGALSRRTIEGGFHMYAFDFVVDKDLRPWLIDTNWFPGMEFASKTPWAHKLQKDLMRDFYTLLFDVQLGDGHYAPDTGGKGSDPFCRNNKDSIKKR